MCKWLHWHEKTAIFHETVLLSAWIFVISIQWRCFRRVVGILRKLENRNGYYWQNFFLSIVAGGETSDNIRHHRNLVKTKACCSCPFWKYFTKTEGVLNMSKVCVHFDNSFNSSNYTPRIGLLAKIRAFVYLP